MIRIVSGRLKGRRLEVPEGARPTTDRTREALFSMLEPLPREARVLDLYAGSGALGIEAVSRGACMLVAVDSSERGHRTLETNLDFARDVEGVTVRSIRGSVRTAVQRLSDPFDIILADPPYGSDDLGTLHELVFPLLAASGVLAIEFAAGDGPPALPKGGWERITTRTYAASGILLDGKKAAHEVGED